MKKIFKSLLAILTGTLLVGCGSDIEIEKPEVKVEQKAEVEYNYVFTKDSGILVDVTNPINKIVDIDLTIKYYDSEENVIKEDSTKLISVHNFALVYHQFLDIPEESQGFVIETDYEVSEIISSVANVLDVLSNDNGRDIDIVVNNYYDQPIDNVSVGVLYLNSGEVVAYNEYQLTDVPASGEKTVTASYPVDINGGIIYFDSIITNANYAYNNN